VTGDGARTSLRVDHAITSGSFSLDGQSFDVENNVWVLGDDDECLLIDAPHDVEAITALVRGRRLLSVLCTHAHDDHVRYAPAIGEQLGAPVLLHPADLPVWALTHPDRGPDAALRDGQVIMVAGAAVEVVHTPGHSPGSVCFRVPALGLVFTGDTLFQGGPGATGRSFSDHPTIIASIRDRLLTLPAETVVHTGHGPSTTIAAEAPALAGPSGP
jgi:glyoxylase-like metal-dependent hydrolase (beta-lactamase superfamily II)